MAPLSGGVPDSSTSPARQRRVVFGVVARGPVAVGVVALGGVSVGVVALGGVAVGVVALGAISVGAVALGGIVVGWRALGALTLGATWFPILTAVLPWTAVRLHSSGGLRETDGSSELAPRTGTSPERRGDTGGSLP